jgi:hypothetical protein
MAWGIAGNGAVKRVSRYRVLMSFKRHLSHGWAVQFLDEACQNTYPLRLRFEFSDKIVEMHERWGASRVAEDKQALQHGMNGAGALSGLC